LLSKVSSNEDKQSAKQKKGAALPSS